MDARQRRGKRRAEGRLQKLTGAQLAEELAGKAARFGKLEQEIRAVQVGGGVTREAAEVRRGELLRAVDEVVADAELVKVEQSRREEGMRNPVTVGGEALSGPRGDRIEQLREGLEERKRRRGKREPSAWEAERDAEDEAYLQRMVRKELAAVEAERRAHEAAVVEHRRRVENGQVWEPRGGWDSDAAEALAAVFSSSFLFESLRPRFGDSVTVVNGREQRDRLETTTVSDLVALYSLLGALADAGGQLKWQGGGVPALPVNKGFIAGYPADQLARLARHGWIVRSAPPDNMITLGPRVVELRDSYRDRIVDSAREQARPERPSLADRAKALAASVTAGEAAA